MDLLQPFLVTLILLFAVNLYECRPRISDGSLNLSEEEGFIGVTISEKGLNYARDLLVDQALQSLVPLRIPDMQKTVKIRYILDLKAKLYDARIANISVPASKIILGKTGISIIASQVQVNLSMKWKYSYKTGLIPITVSDKGRAFVQVRAVFASVNFRF
ncbi:hypothetical protein SUGI_0992880 [Cryptomeria japonica]|nr:hypothetical protein SUGI_0992880 [Cryptomeria japonica]